MADDSDEVPPLKRKRYADFCLDRKDWERMKLMKEVLQVHNTFHLISALANHFSVQEPASATQTFSSSSDPTVWRTIPILEFMIKTWENMVAKGQFEIVHDALTEGLNNLAKWYKKTDDSVAYFICLGTLLCKHGLIVAN